MRTLNSIDDVYVYDNPDTQCREMFKHGHLLTFYPAKAFDPQHAMFGYHCEGADKWVQDMYASDMLGLGPYEEGQTFGNAIHKPFDPLATQIYTGQEIE